jgi:TRAP-type C4-dicarboxylate transport system permease small subunit
MRGAPSYHVFFYGEGIAVRGSKAINLISRLYRAVRYTAGIAASCCIFVMVCTIVPDSIGRFFFSKPLYGTLELNMLLMSAIVFLGLAWTQSQRGHVRVEVMVSRARPTLQSVLNIVCWTIAFALFLGITIGGTEEAIHSASIGENLWGVKKFPVWPGKILAAFGSGLLCVQFLIDIGGEFVHVFLGRKPHSGPTIESPTSEG